jgi:F1F0 ATPase subunit 2
MNEVLRLILPLVAGILLGALFFGGLWWTVNRGVSSQRPALWFFGSSMLRTSMALAGFYFVSGGDRVRLPVCLLGFVVARLVMTWLTPRPGNSQAGPPREASHAS